MAEFISTLSTVDWLLLGLVCLWIPIQEFIAMPLNRRTLEAGVPRARLNIYSQSISMLWLAAGAILVVWALEGRDFAKLGFRFEGTTAEWLAVAAALVIGAAFAFQLFQLHAKPEMREAYGKAAGTAEFARRCMPNNGVEHRRFLVLGTTAGITEEIIFRGFLIWALAHFMPIWIAAVVALALFVVLHAYQGLSQLPGVTIAGAVLTVMYVASGSIYPAIAAHILVDVLNAMVWRVGTADRFEGKAVAQAE